MVERHPDGSGFRPTDEAVPSSPKASIPDAGEPSDCWDCDGFGVCWNNADPTSGQWVPCDQCGDERGHP